MATGDEVMGEISDEVFHGPATVLAHSVELKDLGRRMTTAEGRICDIEGRIGKLDEKFDRRFDDLSKQITENYKAQTEALNAGVNRLIYWILGTLATFIVLGGVAYFTHLLG